MEVSKISSYCSRTSCSLTSDFEQISEQTADSILFQDGWVIKIKLKHCFIINLFTNKLLVHLIKFSNQNIE